MKAIVNIVRTTTKKFFYTAAVLVLLASNAVSYKVGLNTNRESEKSSTGIHYQTTGWNKLFICQECREELLAADEAACLFSDIIRCQLDHNYDSIGFRRMVESFLCPQTNIVEGTFDAPEHNESGIKMLNNYLYAY